MNNYYRDPRRRNAAGIFLHVSEKYNCIKEYEIVGTEDKSTLKNEYRLQRPGSAGSKKDMSAKNTSEKQRALHLSYENKFTERKLKT